MVLQMEPHSAIIWGFGTVGATVNISVNIQDVYSTKVVEGNNGQGVWAVKIRPQHAATTTDIQGVHDDRGMLQWILLKNVIFGDVYVCSGQSNMQFTMAMVNNSAAELKNTTNYPNIRIFTVGEKISDTPLYDVDIVELPWSKPSPDTVGGKPWTYFSAVCWLYGKYLYDHLHIPIGLIASSVGGTPIEAWSPPAVVDICEKTLSNEVSKKSSNSNIDIPPPQNNSVLYNAMIHPLVNITIKGIVWYQGEQNTGYHPDSYSCMFTNMIKAWRKNWYIGTQMSTDSDIPFGFVQVCDITGPHPNYPQIRWHQTADYGYAPNPEMENTFMAVSMDLPDHDSPYSSVHPRDKQDVALRLVAGALSTIYHHTLVYDGPFPQKISESEDHQLHIQYSNYQNLVVSDENNFQICCRGQICGVNDADDDENWHNAQILNHTEHSIVLDAKGCSDHFEVVNKVRYAWAQSPCSFKKCSVYNTLEYPAAPFILPVSQP